MLCTAYRLKNIMIRLLLNVVSNFGSNPARTVATGLVMVSITTQEIFKMWARSVYI